jgi:hypothetical protein
MTIGDAAELSKEWREGVQRDIRNLLTSTQNLNTAVSGLQEVARAHQERLEKLEASPEGVRGWLGVILQVGGCLSMLLAALISVAAIVVTVLATLR